MAFGFLGLRRRGPRRDRGGWAAPPGARLPHERDETVQRQPARPRDKMRQAADDQQSERVDTEARWRANEEFSENARTPSEKPHRPVIIRKRYRI
jgi:hypothetical protein